MKFGPYPVAECEGAYLAHSVMAGTKRLKKGLKLSEEEVALLHQAGVETVIVAKLEVGDLHEDAAATLVAEKVAGKHVTCQRAFTGRVNITAETDGIAAFDIDKINALNTIDESVTLATLSQFSMVTKGQLVATAKIIPLSVPSKAVEILEHSDLTKAVSVRPYEGKKCTLIQTELAATKQSIYDKSAKILSQRVVDFGAVLNGEARCAHDVDELAALLLKPSDSDITLIMGASAITDRRDVIPAAIEQAGGRVIHFGMPVDPGNLLLVARIGETWVLGLPGCARSPKLNGIDYILSRLCAGMNIRSSDIMGMGVGGLLSEYVGRPQPRSGKVVSHTQKPKVAIAVLAAGSSSRMGERNKLLLPYGDDTVLDHVLSEAQAAGASDVFLVTGHEKAVVEAVSENQKVRTVHNEHYSNGMSSSVKAAIKHVPDACEAVLIVLGDMPGLNRETFEQIIAAYNPTEGRNLIVPTHDGKRGNPILWGREYFAAFENLKGDKGAKSLLNEYQQDIVELEVESDAIFLDIDTAEAYRKFVGQVK